ncbi:hypothetical protein D3C73_993880 [compost metagenome]
MQQSHKVLSHSLYGARIKQLQIVFRVQTCFSSIKHIEAAGDIQRIPGLHYIVFARDKGF